jgi:hypothetical protein
MVLRMDAAGRVEDVKLGRTPRVKVQASVATAEAYRLFP